MSVYHKKKQQNNQRANPNIIRKYRHAKEGLIHKSDKYKNLSSERQIR